jgi:hypothetical protein
MTLTYGTEAIASLAATLDSGKGYGCGVSATAKGYMMGGSTNYGVSNSVVIEDIDFGSETSAAITATLDNLVCAGCGVQN